MKPHLFFFSLLFFLLAATTPFASLQTEDFSRTHVGAKNRILPDFIGTKTPESRITCRVRTVYLRKYTSDSGVPSENGLNWTGYVGGDPVNMVDPSGYETEILVGHPYTKDGEEHPYGHVAVRIKRGDRDTVYDFGRYGLTWFLGSRGEGILNKRYGPSYLWGEATDRNTTGYTFETSEEEERLIMKHFETQITDEGTILLDILDNKRGARYKILKDYHYTNNNCTTQVGDSVQIPLQRLLPKTHKDIFKNEYLPLNLQKNLENMLKSNDIVEKNFYPERAK